MSANDPEGRVDQIVGLRSRMLAVGEQLLAALAVENELNRRLTRQPADPIAHEDRKICHAAIEQLAAEYLHAITACRMLRRGEQGKYGLPDNGTIDGCQ